MKRTNEIKVKTITRTIKVNTLTVMYAVLDKGIIEYRQEVVYGDYSTADMLRIVKAKDTAELMAVAITDNQISECLYGISEWDFIQHGHIINK